MGCDMCGADEELLQADVEGTEMRVCKKCSQFGNVIHSDARQPVKKFAAASPVADDGPLETVIPNFAHVVKDRREALNLKQEDLARRLAEKVSTIHKVETGNYTPSIGLARKMEAFLKIKLVERVDGGKEHVGVKSQESLTIGDFIKIKK